jgi:hypothetical protein
MQEKLAYGCRKSRTFDAGKTGLLMQKKLVCRCGKSRDAALVALARWQTLSANQRLGFAPLGPDLRPASIWLLGLKERKSAPAAKAAASAWAVRPH